MDLARRFMPSRLDGRITSVDMTVLLGSYRNVTRLPILEPERITLGRSEIPAALSTALLKTGSRLLPEAALKIMPPDVVGFNGEPELGRSAWKARVPSKNWPI